MVLYIGDLIGIPDDQWNQIYISREYMFGVYCVTGVFIFIANQDNLNDKMVKELSMKIHKQNENVIVMNNLQESIFIKSEHKIDFMNQNFISLFKN